ncbi:Global nitrogen regulator NrpRII [Candidatus Methanoperedenaceae archaeon GB50]|nr:Global nitrogen regulator NrpRII [Candidatus Methanoperedenaceae archaeon GB37]CAD7769151.1 Global nitrogen regulator NrpRII [Candidatus Methanoperedenaceae archaeon GB50]CAD7776991.1 MAG: Global nitrogen regulator NrpRII [Candidatus Methanoperedenaceae archaeon GB50]
MQFILSRIDELIYGVDFDPERRQGKVIANLTVVHRDDVDGVLEVFRRAIAAGLSPSHFGTLIEGVKLGFGNDEVCICTVCSITIDGVLLKSGIPVNLRFGGVVEVLERRPVRFTDMLLYEGTTIDPLEVLISQELTSVTRMMKTGSGAILANMREVPMIARGMVEERIADLESAGFSGVLAFGEPNSEVLGVETARDHIGIVVLGGSNMVAAAMEEGYNLKTDAMSMLIDIEEMKHIDKI